jgi:hypothetical protein
MMNHRDVQSDAVGVQDSRIAQGGQRRRNGRWLQSLALLGALGLTACSGASEDGGEPGEPGGDDIELGQAEQAWSSVSCGRESTAAHETFTGGIDPAHVSPRTYNACTKSYVVDVFDLDEAYTGEGLGGGPDAHLQVSWADTRATTQAACEDTEGGAIFYRRINNRWVDQTGQIYSTGRWIEAGRP